MRVSRRPRITSARPANHAIQSAGKRASRLAAITTVILCGGSLLTLSSGGLAAAGPAAPAPGATVSAVVNGTHAPRLFYVSSDGQVWMRDLARPASSPVNLGGRLLGGPAAVWIPPGDLFAAGAYAVFGRGTDSALWWKYQTASGWSQWASLGGGLTSGPAVSATPTYGGASSSLAFVYARGTDGALWLRVLDHGRRWQPWGRIGGRLLPGTRPAAAENDGLFVAVTGTDRASWVAMELPGGPGFAWRSLGGRTTVTPGIAAPSGNTVVAFARGTDSAAWYSQFWVRARNVAAGWHSLGGGLTSGPTAIPTIVDMSQGPAYLFALGTDSQVWMRTGTWPALHAWTRP